MAALATTCKTVLLLVCNVFFHLFTCLVVIWTHLNHSMIIIFNTLLFKWEHFKSMHYLWWHVPACDTSTCILVDLEKMIWSIYILLTKSYLFLNWWCFYTSVYSAFFKKFISIKILGSFLVSKCGKKLYVYSWRKKRKMG